MPPQTIIDLSNIDLDKVLFDQEHIRQYNPQRGDMEHLDGITWVDTDLEAVIGFKNVHDKEFWVPGHIPGRPLLPGVIMIEAAAQLASFYTKKYVGWTGFIGFGGIEECKFRGQVAPGCRLFILCKKIWDRHRRIRCNVQGLVNGQVVFETGIVGTQM